MTWHGCENFVNHAIGYYCQDLGPLIWIQGGAR